MHPLDILFVGLNAFELPPFTTFLKNTLFRQRYLCPFIVILKLLFHLDEALLWNNGAKILKFLYFQGYFIFIFCQLLYPQLLTSVLARSWSRNIVIIFHFGLFFLINLIGFELAQGQYSTRWTERCSYSQFGSRMILLFNY